MRQSPASFARFQEAVRLFNYAVEQATDEEEFRFTLIDLKNSFNGAVTLTVDPQYSVFLGAHFGGTHTLRSFLPNAKGNGVVLGTLPDPTFGGLIYGMSNGDVEEFVAKQLLAIPVLSTIFPFRW